LPLLRDQRSLAPSHVSGVTQNRGRGVLGGRTALLGAILVLVFALTQGLFWAGVAATFAMAFGTALTVSALATAALGSRELALKLGRGGGACANAVWTTCALGGSVLILVFGATLFAASLGPARPFQARRT
jgi:nickel/cobalt exporter